MMIGQKENKRKAFFQSWESIITDKDLCEEGSNNYPLILHDGLGITKKRRTTKIGQDERNNFDCTGGFLHNERLQESSGYIINANENKEDEVIKSVDTHESSISRSVQEVSMKTKETSAVTSNIGRTPNVIRANKTPLEKEKSSACIASEKDGDNITTKNVNTRNWEQNYEILS